MKKITSSDAKVGTSLAKEVASKLENGAILAYTHRDYCGIGLRYADGKYVCGEVFDGTLPSPEEFEAWPDKENVEWRTFKSRSHFVTWLTEQTDHSLAGKNLPQAFYHDNQRLTIERLQDFVNDRNQ